MLRWTEPRVTLGKTYREIESRTNTILTGNANAASHYLGQLFTNGKSQTGSTKFTGGGTFRLGKGCKDRFKTIRWNSDTGIAHFKKDRKRIGLFLFKSGTDDNLTTGGKLDSITGKIGNNLPYPPRITPQTDRNSRIDGADQFKSFFSGTHRQ